jgi:hypothetical protein
MENISLKRVNSYLLARRHLSYNAGGDVVPVTGDIFMLSLPSGKTTGEDYGGHDIEGISDG